jgi:hypothetical protein
VGTYIYFIVAPPTPPCIHISYIYTYTKPQVTAQAHGRPDMADLDHLHEASLLHNLARRHKASLPYTATGPIVLAVNPYRWLDGLYAEGAAAQCVCVLCDLFLSQRGWGMGGAGGREGVCWGVAIECGMLVLCLYVCGVCGGDGGVPSFLPSFLPSLPLSLTHTHLPSHTHLPH